MTAGKYITKETAERVIYLREVEHLSNNIIAERLGLKEWNITRVFRKKRKMEKLCLPTKVSSTGKER